jgi:hypothetical protein
MRQYKPSHQDLAAGEKNLEGYVYKIDTNTTVQTVASGEMM